jgi:hypothetical protein
VVRFSKEEIPQAHAFWSITLYDERFNMIDNPIERYSIGSLSESLQYEPDGSLEILIQHQQPARVREANWLPAPKGKFNLFLRTYLPGPGVLQCRAAHHPSLGRSAIHMSRLESATRRKSIEVVSSAPTITTRGLTP